MLPYALLRFIAPGAAAAATAAAGGGAAAAAGARAATADAVAARLAAAGAPLTAPEVVARLLGCGAGAGRAAAVGAASAAAALAWPLALRAAHRNPPRWSSTHSALRDVIIAPLTEEWAFRGCLLPLLLLSGSRPVSAALFSAAAFAAAHLHHHVATWLACKGGRLPPGLVAGAAAQLGVTGAFGLAAAALTLATGSPISAVAAHAVANAVGLPSGRRPRGRAAPAAAAVGATALAAAAAAAWRRGWTGPYADIINALQPPRR